MAAIQHTTDKSSLNPSRPWHLAKLYTVLAAQLYSSTQLSLWLIIGWSKFKERQVHFKNLGVKKGSKSGWQFFWAATFWQKNDGERHTTTTIFLTQPTNLYYK